MISLSTNPDNTATQYTKRRPTMKNLIALTIVALGLAAGLVGTTQSASAATWQEEAFTDKS